MRAKNFQEYRGIFSYLNDRIRQNGVFNAAGKVIKYARRYFIIARIIRYTSFIVAIIETSAILLILSAILLLSIPTILIYTAITMLSGSGKRKEYNLKLSPLFDGTRNIMFIYTEHGYYNRKSSFLRGMANDFKNRGYTVFVVSCAPFHDHFNTAKEIGEDLYVIKLGYFYYIKKRFLSKLDSTKQTYIS